VEEKRKDAEGDRRSASSSPDYDVKLIKLPEWAAKADWK
jgi:hypothetical protein